MCEDALLEVVGKQSLPLFYRHGNYLAARHLGHAWSNTGKGLLGRYGHLWLHNDESITAQCVVCDFYRRQNLSNTLSIGRFGIYEERAVGTKTCSILLQFGIACIDAKTLVEQLQHESSIARTATKSCLARNTLVQMCVNARNFIIGSQQVVGFHHKIVSLVAAYSVTAYLEVAIRVRRELLAHGLYLQSITKLHGQEYCLQIVVAVVSLLDDIKSEIYFSARKIYHII